MEAPPWLSALADLAEKAPWSGRDLKKGQPTKEAVLELLSDSQIKSPPLERLWMKPATADDPVAFFAMRLKPGGVGHDPLRVLIPRGEMRNSDSGLILYEFPAAAMSLGRNQTLTVTDGGLLFDYLGEASEKELAQQYAGKLVYWV
jgi:hypothetical protein